MRFDPLRPGLRISAVFFEGAEVPTAIVVRHGRFARFWRWIARLW